MHGGTTAEWRQARNHGATEDSLVREVVRACPPGLTTALLSWAEAVREASAQDVSEVRGTGAPTEADRRAEAEAPRLSRRGPPAPPPRAPAPRYTVAAREGALEFAGTGVCK